MVRWLGLGVVVLMIATGFAAGCGSGISESDAQLRCNQLEQSLSDCWSGAAYDTCVGCYEQCGDVCETQATCPATFNCPE